ncbi:ANTAR domain-containing protein [Actinomadura sp. KC06]|uniref:GAF and ANTAR domain-containing protein n=1 Tax=Actinomadura sp. KC06 TaxID=2530369 RepID=UPI0010438743|nr:GAF and ANTAR domain-containing protein [Actinomadura sp. KC06]TDD21259.1 ANTAR domain-containing protein [Actinomadura sp. KC06]
MPQQQRLAEVFVELADTLVADFDLIEFLHRLAERCVELLEVEAAGILLTDQADELQVIAASSEQTRLLELFQLQSRQGPCLDCFATGRPIRVADLAAEAAQWPLFTAAALDAGYGGVLALPMRMRERIIGAMNLFTAHSVVLAADEAATIQGLGQAMADVATIGILGERAAREHELLSQQLQIALNSRVIIEQAKGMLAERHQTSLDQAFAALRTRARDTNRKLADLAQAVIDDDPAVVSSLRPPHDPSRRADQT